MSFIGNLIRKIAREEALKVADECFEAYMTTQALLKNVKKADKKLDKKSDKKPAKKPAKK